METNGSNTDFTIFDLAIANGVEIKDEMTVPSSEDLACMATNRRHAIKSVASHLSGRLANSGRVPSVNEKILITTGNAVFRVNYPFGITMYSSICIFGGAATSSRTTLPSTTPVIFCELNSILYRLV